MLVLALWIIRTVKPNAEGLQPYFMKRRGAGLIIRLCATALIGFGFALTMAGLTAQS